MHPQQQVFWSSQKHSNHSAKGASSAGLAISYQMNRVNRDERVNKFGLMADKRYGILMQ